MKTTIEHAGQVTEGTVRKMYSDGRAEVEFRGGGWLIVAPTLRCDDRHRTLDRDTAVAAAHALSDDRLTDMQMQVLACLDSVGVYGCIDDDYERMCGLRADSAGKRRLELSRRGMVAATDERRRTRRGAMAQVWVITSSGVDALTRHRAAHPATA